MTIQIISNQMLLTITHTLTHDKNREGNILKRYFPQMKSRFIFIKKNNQPIKDDIAYYKIEK